MAQSYFIDRLLKLMLDTGVGSLITMEKEDHIRQETFIDHLRKIMRRTSLPEVTTVALESSTYQTKDQYSHRNEFRDKAHVITWKPQRQVAELLTNTEVFGNLDHLVVNKKDPFGKYDPPSPVMLGEFLTGTWYQGAHQNMLDYHTARTVIRDKKRPFMIPLVLGCDATGTDSYGRLKMEPLPL